MTINSSRDQGTYLSPLIGWHDHSETGGNRAPDYTQRAYCVLRTPYIWEACTTFQSVPKVAGLDGNSSLGAPFGLYYAWRWLARDHGSWATRWSSTPAPRSKLMHGRSKRAINSRDVRRAVGLPKLVISKLVMCECTCEETIRR